MDLDTFDTLALTMADDRTSAHFATLVECFAAFYGMSPEVARAELLARLDSRMAEPTR